MWPFNKKEKPVYVLGKNSQNQFHIRYRDEYQPEYESKIMESENLDLLTQLYISLKYQLDLAEEIKKHITDSMPKGYVDRITIGGDHTFISEPLMKSTIPTVKDIKNMIEDPNIFYAVQGHYPNITVSKYEKVAEDSFNLCLRQETGNLSLLPKSICFNSKADAVIYQNELIQKYSQVKNQNFPGKTTFEFEVEKR